jgi:hypothetical protein
MVNNMMDLRQIATHCTIHNASRSNEITIESRYGVRLIDGNTGRQYVVAYAGLNSDEIKESVHIPIDEIVHCKFDKFIKLSDLPDDNLPR